jgi:hypothetical protein
MEGALGARPQPEFPLPQGVVLVPIDPKTGKPTPEGIPEPFKEEAQPVAEAPADRPRVDLQDLFGE